MIIYVVNTGATRVRTPFSTIMPRSASAVKVGGMRDVKLIENQSRDIIVLSIDMSIISSGSCVPAALRDYMVRKLQSYESATLALSRVDLIMREFVAEQKAAEERQRKAAEMRKRAEEEKAEAERVAAEKVAAEKAASEATQAEVAAEKVAVEEQHVDAISDEIVAQLRSDNAVVVPKKRASRKKSKE